jgi:hypothetical protein
MVGLSLKFKTSALRASVLNLMKDLPFGFYPISKNEHLRVKIAKQRSESHFQLPRSARYTRILFLYLQLSTSTVNRGKLWYSTRDHSIGQSSSNHRAFYLDLIIVPVFIKFTD